MGFHAVRFALLSSVTSLALAGCLAQQAELTQVERNLGTKIAKLDQREKDLQQTITSKEKELQQAINRAKVDLDKLVSETRARLSQQVTELREADLPSMQGGLDKSLHQIGVVRNRVDDLEHQSRAGLEATTKRLAILEKAYQEQAGSQNAAKAERDRLQEDLGKLAARLDAMNVAIGTMAKTLGSRLDEQEKTITNADARAAAVIQQLEPQNRVLADQMAQYGKALAEFKKALGSLGDKLVQEEQRNQDLSAKLAGRVDSLTAKVEADGRATTAHLTEVNKSVGSVAKALENMGGQVMTRVEEQDRRLDETAKTIYALDGQIGSLNQTIAQLRGDRETQAQTLNQTVRQLREERDSKVEALNQTIAQLREERSAEREMKTISQNEGPTRTSGQEQQEQAVRQDPAAVSMPNGPPVAARTAPRTGANHAPARESYERYIATFRQGNLDAALQGFSQFLTQYPNSELAPNAQYWLGECYYGKRDYRRAIEAFDRVRAAYPSSEKVPAALLKKGFAYLALKDPNRASSVWRQVVDGYPRSPEAGKALEKLAQLKQVR
jgi:tol-pal system protein YbgF